MSKDLNQENVTAPTNGFSLSLEAFVIVWMLKRNRLQVEHVCLYLKISIRHYSHHHYPSTWAKRLPGSHDTQLMLRGGKTEYLQTAGGYRGVHDRKKKTKSQHLYSKQIHKTHRYAFLLKWTEWIGNKIKATSV